MSYVEKARKAVESTDSTHNKQTKNAYVCLNPTKPPTPSSPSLARDKSDKSDKTPQAPGSCFDCRDTHGGPTACAGHAFIVGDVIEDSPVIWRRAIHCLVCCPTHGGRPVPTPSLVVDEDESEWLL